MRKTCMNFTAPFGLAILAIATLGAAPASAQLSEGTLSNYTLVDLADGTTIGWNSGPVDGNALFGNGVNVSTSGGNNGGLSGGGVLSYDSSTVCSPSPCGKGLQNPPPTMLVSGPSPSPGTMTGDALSYANTLSNNAAALSPTQTYTSISNGQTITGTSNLNVIDVGSGGIQNANFTINGSANQTFVFNVTGNIQTNRVETLTGGVTANHILFNLLGSSGNIFQTSGGDQLEGTFLATRGGGFQFSNLDLDGQLIMGDANGVLTPGGGNVQLVSGSKISTFSPFTPSTVPEPSTWAMMILGLAAFRYAGFRRRAKTPVT